MRVVVVYESMFGNTRLIADAIATGLQSAGDVSVVAGATPITNSLRAQTYSSLAAPPTCTR